MLTLDATASARSQAAVAGIHYLVETDFASGTIRTTTAPITVTSGGHTWLGLGDLVSVGQLTESADQGAERLEIRVSIVNTAMLATLIGPATEYRNRRVNVYAQFFGETYQPAGAAKLRFAGYMDAPNITRESRETAPGVMASVGEIVIPCWRAGQSRMRNASGLRRTHAQQLQRTGGVDTGLRYTQQLLDQPSLWLSKRFQQV